MASRRWRAWIGGATLLVAGPAARAEGPPDFATRVIPVLTKAGCNAGSCHGAALGRGGFRLSLLGYDPGADHDSLVHEFEGRRVNTARPERSLVLKKGSAAIEHEGGPRLAAGGEGYRVLRDWIAAGAPRGRGRSPSGLEVEPGRDGPGPDRPVGPAPRDRPLRRRHRPRTSRGGPSTRRPTRRPSAARPGARSPPCAGDAPRSPSGSSGRSAAPPSPSRSRIPPRRRRRGRGRISSTTTSTGPWMSCGSTTPPGRTTRPTSAGPGWT